MAGNNLIHNAEVKDKKCATCRHYEPSPLRKRGWCRNPLLYDRNTNHLVEEDSLGCSRGFGSVNYWEPLVLQTGRPALTRHEKELARAREEALAAQNGAVATAEPGVTAGEATMLGPSQAELASMKQGVDADPRTTTTMPVSVSRPLRPASRLRPDTMPAPPAVLRPAGSPAPSPNDSSPNRPRLRGGRPRRAIPATTPTDAENAARIVSALPLTGMEKFKVFILARPWLPVLLVLLLLLGGGGFLYLKSHGLPSWLPVFGTHPTPTATALPTALPTLVQVDTPTPAPLQPTVPPTAPASIPNTLVVGGYATVSGSNSLNVRDQASTTGAVVDQLSSGAVAHLIGGPKQADGYTWWQVDSWPSANGKSGWCAGKFLKPATKP